MKTSKIVNNLLGAGRKGRSSRGFTIVELLIVVVVIGILAVVAMNSYARSQDQARAARINSDLSALMKAIKTARIARGDVALMAITNDAGTAWECVHKVGGTNFATLNKNTDPCWTDYKAALQAIGNAAGTNLTGLEDPWGRPYYIDENETEGGGCGFLDKIGIFATPHQLDTWATVAQHDQYVPYITLGC
ncbi:prepilin-type N-terminal cleavage/methylation domain-containing protein [Candidatus Saccharibacteria bacterium]|nr:prepilin-type N-terminal cleavage/methylation domain-containing protein [Candidatus Saccharibacteria bacterium]